MNDSTNHGFNDKGFENRFQIFFDKKFNIKPQLTNIFNEKQQFFIENEKSIFSSPIVFLGLNKLNLPFTSESRHPDNLKALLSTTTDIFEEYKKILVSNAKKVKSYFDYLDHIRFILDGASGSYIEVIENLDFFQAYQNDLIKNFKIIKNIFDFFDSNAVSLIIESANLSQADVPFEKASKMTMFEISMVKSSLKRQGFQRD